MCVKPCVHSLWFVLPTTPRKVHACTLAMACAPYYTQKGACMHSHYGLCSLLHSERCMHSHYGLCSLLHPKRCMHSHYGVCSLLHPERCMHSHYGLCSLLHPERCMHSHYGMCSLLHPERCMHYVPAAARAVAREVAVHCFAWRPPVRVGVVVGALGRDSIS